LSRWQPPLQLPSPGGRLRTGGAGVAQNDAVGFGNLHESQSGAPDLRAINLRHLRRSLGVVLQDNFLFRPSILKKPL